MPIPRLPHVTVSVLNWNSPENTIRCLKSLEALHYPGLRIIVVDNASRDDSVPRIRAAFPHLTLVEAPTNLGYAGGNALALDKALRELDAELFWIFNNDAEALPDTLDALVRAYQAHGDGLYGGVPVRGTPDAPENWRVKLKFWERINGRLRERRLGGQLYREAFPSLDVHETASLSGSSLLVPLRVVRQNGFIDSSFFLYGEDMDYSFRLARAGIMSYLVPASAHRHADGGSRSDKGYLKPIVLYYQARAHLIVARRHLGTARFVVTLLRQAAYVLGWAVLGLTQGRFALRCAKFTALGVRDAFLGRTGKTFAPEAWLPP